MLIETVCHSNNIIENFLERDIANCEGFLAHVNKAWTPKLELQGTELKILSRKRLAATALFGEERFHY